MEPKTKSFEKKTQMNVKPCIFTSSSFTKATHLLLPSTKNRNPTCSRKISTRFFCKRLGTPSWDICCCHSEPSASSKDEKISAITADWRTYRARLVAAQRATTKSLPIGPSSLAADLDIVTHQPPRDTLGDKWAHKIENPERGCLLLATEKLDGFRIFQRTVILIISTGPMGPSGIILNLPSMKSLREARSRVVDVDGTFSDRPSFYGGPVKEGVVLVSTEGGAPKSGVFKEVMKGLYYGTEESVRPLAETVKGHEIGVGDVRLFEGYCGWNNQHLREEITAGYWTLAACSSSAVHSAIGRGVETRDQIFDLMNGHNLTDA